MAASRLTTWVQSLPLCNQVALPSACLVLGDLLNLTPVALAERFTREATRIGTGRFIAVGDLVTTVVDAHVEQLSSARTGPTGHGAPGVQYSGREPIDLTLDTMRNHMAAQAHNLLLASWAMTVPLAEQRAIATEVLQAVTDALVHSMGDRYPADLMSRFAHTFLTEVRQVFGPTFARRRDIVLGLRSCHDHPRIDAIGPEPFRELLLDVLERSLQAREPRPGSWRACSLSRCPTTHPGHPFAMCASVGRQRSNSCPRWEAAWWCMGTATGTAGAAIGIRGHPNPSSSASPTTS
jgi:hypothetical protein